MVKVMLLFEDFNQLNLAEVCLKKIGFDVLGLSNDHQLFDKMLGFPPEVIIISGRSSRVNSIAIAQKIKDHGRFSGKVILGLLKDQRPDPIELLKIQMDAFLDVPLNPEKLILIVCKMTGLNGEAHLDKFSRFRMSDQDFENRLQSITSLPSKERKGADNIHDPERMKKYQKFIEESPLNFEQTSHIRDKVKSAQDKLKKDWNFDRLEEQDKLRRQFAEALFKKK